jgi:hypothetical protein
VLKIIKLTPGVQPRNDVYGAYDHSYFQASGAQTHTQSPIVTGTSVVAVKFKDGVAIAADNLGARRYLSIIYPAEALPASLKYRHGVLLILWF